MATKAAATAADVTTTPASPPLAADADSGTWTAGPVSTKADGPITIKGAAAIYEASCTFTLQGTKGTSAVTMTDPVTLDASSTTLTSQHGVLRDGNQTTSAHGNKLAISVGAPTLTSS